MNDNSTCPAFSREAALECGDLVDLTECATRAGICVPTAFTRLAFGMAIYHPEHLWWMERQDMAEWLLGNLVRSIRERAPKAGPKMTFWETAYDCEGTKYLLTLVAVMGRTDDGEPCLTIKLRDEE